MSPDRAATACEMFNWWEVNYKTNAKLLNAAVEQGHRARPTSQSEMRLRTNLNGLLRTWIREGTRARMSSAGAGFKQNSEVMSWDAG